MIFRGFSLPLRSRQGEPNKSLKNKTWEVIDVLDFLKWLYYGDYSLIAWAVTLFSLILCIGIEFLNVVRSCNLLKKRK